MIMSNYIGWNCRHDCTYVYGSDGGAVQACSNRLVPDKERMIMKIIRLQQETDCTLVKLCLYALTPPTLHNFVKRVINFVSRNMISHFLLFC